MWPISEQEYVEGSIRQEAMELAAKTFMNIRILKMFLNDPQQRILAQSALDYIRKELDNEPYNDQIENN